MPRCAICKKANSVGNGGLQCKCKGKKMKLKEYRHDKGLTQQKLADRLGCSLQSIKYWETGRRQPSEQWMKKLRKRGIEV